MTTPTNTPTPPTNHLEALIAVRELLTPPENFMQGWFFGDAQHHSRPNNDDQFYTYYLETDAEVITCYCVLGAFEKVYGSSSPYTIPSSLNTAAASMSSDSFLTPTQVNDTLGHAAVLAMLDKAIAIEKQSPSWNTSQSS